MCLAADVPLIESGSSGYLGQVTLIKKGLTECYECRTKAPQRTYPGCTIRNTPSEPVHCVVWAKHLFNQLFGEADPDEDVSPDMADPELQEHAVTGESQPEASSVNGAVNGNGSAATDSPQVPQAVNGDNKANVQRVSTRLWAQENEYDPRMIFHKLFNEDIHYLLSMDNLWKKRQPPSPLTFEDLPSSVAGTSAVDASSSAHNRSVWAPLKCRDVFVDALKSLRERAHQLPEGHTLTWDKDDDVCMDFVSSAANLRSYIFSIPLKSRFDLKSIAGNIVPAIATTNAIVAGYMVLQAMHVLRGNINKCTGVYLHERVSARNQMVAFMPLDPPNPSCYVCSPKPEVIIRLDATKVTLKSLEEKVLKQRLNMVAPDVEITGTGTILISSEEGETTDISSKPLSHFKVGDGTQLSCDDFFQQYTLRLIIKQASDLPADVEFEVISDTSSLHAEALSADVPKPADDATDVVECLADENSEEKSSRKRAHENNSDPVVVKRPKPHDEEAVV